MPSATSPPGLVAAQLSTGTRDAAVLMVVSVGLLLGMQMGFARVLGTEGYGVLSIALTIAGIGGLIGSLGLPNGIMRFASEYVERRQWSLLRGALRRTFQIALVTLALITVGCAAIGLVLPLERSGLREAWFAAAVIAPMIGIGLWRSKATRGLGRIRASLIPEEVMLPGLAILVIVVLRPSSMLGAVITYAAAWFVAELVGFGSLLRGIPPESRVARPVFETRRWVLVSLPMIVASALQLTMNRVDILMLGFLSDMGTTGSYTAAVRIALLATFGLRAVDVAVAPAISAAYHGGRSDDVRVVFGQSRRLSMLGSLPFLVVVMAVPGALLSLFGPGFESAAIVLRILAVGQFVNACTGPVGFALLMTGGERTYARILGLVTVMTVALLAAVIPSSGAVGAAIVSASGVAAANVRMLFAANRHLGVGLSPFSARNTRT